MLSNAILLFFIIDPFGLIPVYINVLKKVPEARRTRVLVRELLIALVALFVFLFTGKYMLSVLHISQPALQVAGALILFLIAVPMIFPTVRLSMETEGDTEPFIVPLAMPLFVGPSAIAMVILMRSSADAGGWPSWIGAILLAWAGASGMLLAGDWIARRVGKRGLVALERLVGMLLVAVSVEMLLGGVSGYLAMEQPAGAASPVGG